MQARPDAYQEAPRQVQDRRRAACVAALGALTVSLTPTSLFAADGAAHSASAAIFLSQIVDAQRALAWERPPAIADRRRHRNCSHT